MARYNESRLGIVPAEAVKPPVVTVSDTPISLVGEQTIGSTPVVSGDRVLVAGQLSSPENGIYIVKTGAWVRASDWNGTKDVINGAIVLSTDTGVLYRSHVLSSGEFVVGSTSVTFSSVLEMSLSPIITEEVVSTADQTIFTSVEPFVDGVTQVYVDGSLVSPSAYTVLPDGYSIEFFVGQTEGAVVTFQTISSSPAPPPTDASDLSYTLVGGGTVSIEDALNSSVSEVSLTGDVTGTSVRSGSSLTVETTVGLPVVIEISGGSASTVFTASDPSLFGAGAALPVGGTTGQVLAKASDSDGDVVWADGVAGGSSSTTQEYFTGYTFTYVDDTTWKVVGFDVSNLYSIGRRVKFLDGANTYYGLVSAAIYSAGDTTLTMTMEDSAILTDTITDAALYAGNSVWIPIAADPFEGSAIEAIETGIIGVVAHWVAVGVSGKAFYSTDQGLTWTAIVTGTTETFNDVAYSPTEEAFMMVGTNQVIGHWDGTTYTDRTPSVAVSDGTGAWLGVDYYSAGSGWIVVLDYSTAQNYMYYSTDSGATWTQNAGFNTVSGGYKAVSPDGTANIYISGTSGAYVYTLTYLTDASVSNTTYTTNSLLRFEVFIDGITQIIIGSRNNNVYTSITGGSIVYDSTNIPNNTVAFAYSPLHLRGVVVCEGGQIATIEKAAMSTSDAWTLRPNGSSPTANFTNVTWDASNAKFIAVNDLGEILVSNNGAS